MAITPYIQRDDFLMVFARLFAAAKFVGRGEHREESAFACQRRERNTPTGAHPRRELGSDTPRIGLAKRSDVRQTEQVCLSRRQNNLSSFTKI